MNLSKKKIKIKFQVFDIHNEMNLLKKKITIYRNVQHCITDIITFKMKSFVLIISFTSFHDFFLITLSLRIAINCASF